VTTDLESRIRQLEDRALISEQVIRYAMGVDRRDWAMFADCFTDPVYADFSGGGIPAATVSRADLVARVSTALNGFTATQHISPNHVIEFDGSDPSRAICHSYMYAQHLLRGWRIERIIQHRSWEYGNTSAVTEAIARSQAQAPADSTGITAAGCRPRSESGQE